MELESIGESIPILSSSSDNILTLTTTFFALLVYCKRRIQGMFGVFLELVSAKNTLHATKKLPM